MRTKTYFISDLHLGAGYIENPREHELRVVKWLREIKNDAERLYLLGDILDYWYEYKSVVPRGFVRFFGALAELADAGVKITWFIGNHDIWIFDYLPREIGIEVVDGYKVVDISGKRFFLSHGDGIGALKPGFRFIRSVFRNKVCQKLFSAIHPRWTVGFAHSWSSHSRTSSNDETGFLGDKDPFMIYARDYLHKEHIDYFVFGHRHSLVDEYIADKSRLIILGDWINQFSYGVFDGCEFRLISNYR